MRHASRQFHRSFTHDQLAATSVRYLIVVATLPPAFHPPSNPGPAERATARGLTTLCRMLAGRSPWHPVETPSRDDEPIQSGDVRNPAYLAHRIRAATALWTRESSLLIWRTNSAQTCTTNRYRDRHRHRRCGARTNHRVRAGGGDPVVVLGQNLNLMWIVIGAILVIFMQAGFALVETGFCQAKHAAHVVSTNFAIFAPRLRRLLPHRLSPGVRRLQLQRFRADRPGGEPLLGSGSWVFLWEGGWALSGDTDHAGARRILPLHGGLHGHRCHDPDRVHGRALEMGQLRHLGPLLRCGLLPAVCGVDVGWRLAVARSGTR